MACAHLRKLTGTGASELYRATRIRKREAGLVDYGGGGKRWLGRGISFLGCGKK